MICYIVVSGWGELYLKCFKGDDYYFVSYIFCFYYL